MSTASALGLLVDDAVVVHDSNRIAVRLLPCDVLARVAYGAHQAGARFEVEVARRLAQTDSPVAEPEPRVEPRVYVRGGFAVTLWKYYEPVPTRDIAPSEYAQVLERLHAGMRQIDVTAPHFTDRIAEAQSLVGNRAHTPELADTERELLSKTLRNLRRARRRAWHRRAVAARRAASGQLAQDEERAALCRPRDMLPRTCRVRHRACAPRSQ